MSFKITHRFFKKHPLTKNALTKAYWRFAKWQILSRFHKGYFEYPFIENAKLYVKNGMTGATGNIYAGLHEFEDMAFLLHSIRNEDLFLDVGANVGSYTVLASAVVGAKTFTFEPVPSTFNILQKNIEINHIENLVTAYNNGVGDTHGTLRFTNLGDTVNHVITDVDTNQSFTEVEVITLDNILTSTTSPIIMKLDVEGFEKNVLIGAEKLLNNHLLKAIIIELNGCCHRYGVQEQEIHTLLLNAGFKTYDYAPFERKLSPIPNFHNEENTIYIKDLDWVKNRVETSRKYKVLDKEF